MEPPWLGMVYLCKPLSGGCSSDILMTRISTYFYTGDFFPASLNNSKYVCVFKEDLGLLGGGFYFSGGGGTTGWGKAGLTKVQLRDICFLNMPHLGVFCPRNGPN